MKPETYTTIWRIAIAIWFGIGLALMVTSLVLQSTGQEGEGKGVAMFGALHIVLTPIIFVIYDHFESRYYDQYYRQGKYHK